MKGDKAQAVIDSIIASIEKGTPPWKRPWEASTSSGLPLNPTTNREYSGFNILNLWYEQIEKGFESSLWMGFHQGAKAGGSVRKGEKGTSILRMNTIKDDNGDVKCVLPATAVVFNLDQFNGLDELKPTFTQHQWTPIESAEALLSSTGAIIEYGGDKAFYRKSDDKIRLPERSRFHDESGFYATAIHELGHWTGHSSRLDRDTKGKYGSEAYAFEELVADIASAITQARIGLHADIEGHASYVESWLKCLQQDQRAILKASSLAQKASDFLLRKNNEHPQE